MMTPGPEEKETNAHWRLRLYISGQTVKSIAAIQNITSLCEQLVPGNFQLEIVDILEDPAAGEDEQILALPLLVRLNPKPRRRIIGDLSDPEATAVALNLRKPNG
jgi:circadian clock protein KaiB